MTRFRLMEQASGSDGAVTVVHAVYGYSYQFNINPNRSGLSEGMCTKKERAQWFGPEAKHFAETEARKRKIIK